MGFLALNEKGGPDAAFFLLVDSTPASGPAQLASHAPADPEQAGTEQCHRLRLGHAVACDVQSPFVQTSPQPPTVVHVPACESRFVPNRNDTSITSGADVSPVNANVNVTGPTSNGLCWWLLNPP